MYRIINERNVNQAYAAGLLWLMNRGTRDITRVGPVVVAQEPVITRYAMPDERVLFSTVRDANPFFHFMEGLWMLAGRNDVPWPTQFNSTFGQFSDDGKTFHGAYGFRWRQYFGYDQLNVVIGELKRDPTSRRCVLAMWDGGCWGEDDGSTGDLNTAIAGGKDVPCNTHVYLRVQHGRLDMQINNRSNDIIWGAYGANAVHMSMLHEYLARSIGVNLGVMYQASFNFHAYTEKFPLEDFKDMARDAVEHDYYSQGLVKPYPLMQVSQEEWDIDLDHFMRVAAPPEESDTELAPPTSWNDPLWDNVAIPMLLAWRAHKGKNYRDALHHANDIAATDWRKACVQWLERRRLRLEQRNSTNV